jgi:acylglycerol lipase
VLGHSAGGVIAANYVLSHPRVAAGLICESSAFRAPAPQVVLDIIAFVARFAPRLPVLRLDNTQFSCDRAVVAALEQDPLIHKEVQPARTVAAMHAANKRLEAGLPTFTLPLLVLHGTADKVTLVEGSKRLHALAGSPDKVLRLYEGHVRDLLADLGRDDVLGEICSWIDAHLRGAQP